jgi:hypothetical protein
MTKQPPVVFSSGDSILCFNRSSRLLKDLSTAFPAAIFSALAFSLASSSRRCHSSYRQAANLFC